MNTLFLSAIFVLLLIFIIFFIYLLLQLNPMPSWNHLRQYLPSQPRAKSVKLLERKFTWHFKEKAFTINLAINPAHYHVHVGHHERSLNIWEYHRYAKVIPPEIENLSQQLQALNQSQGFTPYDQVCNIVAFTQQSIRYTRDMAPGTNQVIDHPKYPLETLTEKNGDCEDQVILVTALLWQLGFDVAVLMCPTHAALGIAGLKALNGEAVLHPPTGKSYFYTEMTAQGWLPGQVPEVIQERFDEEQFKALPVVA